jgi:hypothetical protein
MADQWLLSLVYDQERLHIDRHRLGQLPPLMRLEFSRSTGVHACMSFPPSWLYLDFWAGKSVELIEDARLMSAQAVLLAVEDPVQIQVHV